MDDVVMEAIQRQIRNLDRELGLYRERVADEIDKFNRSVEATRDGFRRALASESARGAPEILSALREVDGAETAFGEQVRQASREFEDVIESERARLVAIMDNANGK